MNTQYNTFVSDWVDSFVETKKQESAPDKFNNLKWSLRDATANVNIFLDSSVKSSGAVALPSNLGTFKELSTMINKLLSTYGLLLSVGFIILIINDVVDQAPVENNYEKYRLKCLLSTGLVLFSILLYLSSFHKIFNDIDDTERSAPQ